MLLSICSDPYVRATLVGGEAAGSATKKTSILKKVTTLHSHYVIDRLCMVATPTVTVPNSSRLWIRNGRNNWSFG